MDERMADKEAEKHRLSLIILLKQLIEVLKKDLAASEKRANENAIKELEKKVTINNENLNKERAF
uniref:Uncharacterized protein n=1 Tax=Meloidogyne hapla TaxID=6305 RepID=A0A1I8B509_MELHA